ncbi:hypothetical protein COV19_07540 [Candidatus Woesearchaeota archaeon CG10_big_fil_rev_8_21_14_0_10_44_13]|nr:MAG: hypothetical protein COV19_07540 [Candidatus Woesearchaeota archaeon CG10_big_fil_rev_8_21_14_0_10_44_13]
MERQKAGSERKNRILVIDNGTQYGQLYAKRFRDLGMDVESIDAGVYCDEDGNLVRPKVTLDDVAGFACVVIAGGRSSVTDAPDRRVDIDPRIYSDYEGPLLGTCFGHQDMADRLGGKVVNGLKQCGPVYTTVNLKNPFFEGLGNPRQRVNSTHNDGVMLLPPGFNIIAHSYSVLDDTLHIDAMFRDADNGKRNYRIGTQFHPETFLSENGSAMLLNFIRLSGLEPKEIKGGVKTTPNIDGIVNEQYPRIKDTIKDLPVFLPLSGGVDSTVSTEMLLRAGIAREKIHAFHIDTGFNRYGESEEVVREYHAMGWNFVGLLDKKEFFANFSLSEDELKEYRPDLAGKGLGDVKLKDAVYSEHKRVLFQVAYDFVITGYQRELGLDETNSVLVQGTNHADKVESGKGGKKRSGSARIKTHHNVGKFSDRYKEAGHLLEPMDRFFKSDIYELARRYELPVFFSTRKPFPGPGELIRIGSHNMVDTGMYTRQQINRLETTANEYSRPRGISTYVTPLEAVGTCGDERAEGAMALLQFEGSHEERVTEGIMQLMDAAGQIPHYTTFGSRDCITRLMTPLFAFDTGKKPSFSRMKNEGKYVEMLQLFDKEVNNLVDRLGIKMTQTVNYIMTDSLGEEGKYTFVFRPWIAPDLMSGMPLIPSDKEVREQLFGGLKALKEKYDFIGNICIDLTYKPIGGTEIN